MEDYLSPAFYMIPAIDNTFENVIYINQSRNVDTLKLFTTLAHEGYPGHLYQTTYFAEKNTEPLRSIFNFSGYVEGWATTLNHMPAATPHVSRCKHAGALPSLVSEPLGASYPLLAAGSRNPQPGMAPLGCVSLFGAVRHHGCVGPLPLYISIFSRHRRTI